MAEAVSTRVPGWYWAAAGIGLLWNIFGVINYLHSAGMFGDPIASLNEAQRAAAASIPAAITAAFAIGTFAGVIGSLGLLLRKRWAWPVLLISLIALVVLEGWIVFLSGHLDAFGPAIPIAVTLGALSLAWLANLARQRGWLR